MLKSEEERDHEAREDAEQGSDKHNETEQVGLPMRSLSRRNCGRLAQTKHRERIQGMETYGESIT